MYAHTQYGRIYWIICGPIILALWIIAIVHPIPAMTETIVISIAILIALILFGILTVNGDDRELSFHFGLGIIKKRFLYTDIKSAQKVRNHWFWGWGIRWFGRGWLYNVSGLDAIELSLKNGRALRIGTDEPDRLLAFLTTKIGK